jgi:hypothetical protein
MPPCIFWFFLFPQEDISEKRAPQSLVNAVFMRLLIGFLFFLPTVFCWCSSERTIHAVLVGDTNSNIRATVRHDLEHMRSALKVIARKTKMHLVTKTITGSRVTESKVRAMTNLLAQTRGISIFYFSGHGFRFPDAHSPWPRLTFMEKNESMNGESITSSLKKGKARLTLLIFDCCNQPVPYLKSPHFLSKIPAAKQKLSWSTAQTLFMKTNGVVIMAAAIPGEVARGSGAGSFFTTSLLESLSSSQKAQKTSWNDIFKDVQRRCVYMNQHPICELLLT